MEKNAGTARRRSTSSRRQDTKVAVVTRRLRAKRGASIDDHAIQTGWQKGAVSLMRTSLQRARGQGFQAAS